VNGTPDMLWQTDRDGRCTYVSETLSAFVGRSAQQQLGDDWLTAVHSDDRERVLGQLHERMRAGNSFLIAFRLRRADGTWEIVKSAGVPHLRDGELVGYMGGVYVVQDVPRKHPGVMAKIERIHAVPNKAKRCRAEQPADLMSVARLTESR